MKKIILILVLTLTLIMSGCSGDNPDYMIDDWEREDRLDFIDGLRDCYDINFDDEDCMVQDVRFYTQSEVDLIIQEIEDSFDAQAMNNLNERLYYLENELRDFERFEYEDLLAFMEYIEHGEFENDLEEYIDDKLSELEDTKRDVNYDISIMTVALYDIMIMVYNDIENPTEAEIAEYEMIVAFRQLILNEIGE